MLTKLLHLGSRLTRSLATGLPLLHLYVFMEWIGWTSFYLYIITDSGNILALTQSHPVYRTCSHAWSTSREPTGNVPLRRIFVITYMRSRKENCCKLPERSKQNLPVKKVQTALLQLISNSYVQDKRQLLSPSRLAVETTTEWMFRAPKLKLNTSY